MENIILRTAQKHDSEKISVIYGYHVSNGLASWEIDPPTPAIICERMVRLNTKDYPYIVAMLDNELVGYAYAGSYRERPGYRYVVENSVYVDHNYPRRGIGRQLLSRLVIDCTNLGYRHMLAVIETAIISVPFNPQLAFKANCFLIRNTNLIIFIFMSGFPYSTHT